MRVSELLDEKVINLNLKAKNKDEVIDELIDQLEKAEVISDRQGFKKDILAREALSTTGIGFGIAIPHAKSKAVRFPTVAFGVSRDGIDYDSIDDTKANLFFMIAVNEGDNNLHLKALATLSRMLIHEEFREALLDAKDSVGIMKVIKENESKF